MGFGAPAGSMQVGKPATAMGWSVWSAAWTGTDVGLDAAVKEGSNTKKGRSRPGGWVHGEASKGPPCGGGRGGLDRAVGGVP